MATALGINNPNSHYNRSLRTAQLDDLMQAARKSSSLFTITAYAWKIYPRYEAALIVAKGGLPKGERLALEYETQLAMLADYAGKEEAGKS